MAAPGVAAAYALGGEPKALDGAVLFKSLDAILAASGRIAATARHPWRDDELVCFDEHDKGETKYLLDAGHGAWLVWPVRAAGPRQ